MKPNIYTNIHHRTVRKVLKTGRVMRQDCGLDPTSLAPDHWLPSNTTDKVWFWKLTTRYFFRHFLGWFDYHTISKELGLVGREIVVNPFYERYKPLNELRNILNISSE